MDKYIIRPESPEDYLQIHELIDTAFKTANISNGDEADYADTLRDESVYINQLALVAETDEKKLIGHVMITKIHIETKADGNVPVLLVEPLSVLMEYRGCKVGASLLMKGLEEAKELEYKAVFLYGEPEYYTRFGFLPAVDFGITHSTKIPDRNVLCYELYEDALKEVEGVLSVKWI